MRLDTHRSLLMMIDLQESLLALIDRRDAIVEAARFLIAGCGIFELPMLATEQYPKGIGPTAASVRAELERLNVGVLQKLTFSCCGDGAIRNRLQEFDREQIIVTGIETHVCVQQTALDLLSMEYPVYVCADAVGSRGDLDHFQALDRLGRAGAVITTTESVLFELCTAAGTDRFKAMLELVKARQSANAGTRA